MKLRWIYLVMLLFTFPCTLCSQGKVAVVEIYLSPKGKAEASGTQNDPFSSLEAAIDFIKNKAKSGVKEVRFNFSGGNYSINKPLVIDNSIANGAVLTFVGKKGEEAVISGAAPLNLRWQKSDLGSNIWMANAPKGVQFRSLFAGNKRLERASSPIFFTASGFPEFKNRYKKWDYQSVQHLKSQDLLAFCGFVYRNNDLDNLHFNSGTELVVYNSWEATWQTIYEIDKSKKRIVLKSPARYPVGYFSDRVRYRVENSIDYLRSPGQWVLDADKQLLFYYASNGEDPNKTKFSYPALETLIHIKGVKNGKLANITFDNITFAHSRSRWGITDTQKQHLQNAKRKYPWVDAMKGYSDAQVAPDCGEAVLLEYVSHSTVKNSRFRDLENYGIRLGRGVDNSVVLNNKFANNGGGGIVVGFNVQKPVASGIPLSDSPTKNRVEGNNIGQSGWMHPASVGIALMQANNTIVENNVLHELPYTGISIGWTFDDTPNYTFANVVEGNRISKVMQVLADGAGIYTLGDQKGTIIAQNYVANIKKAPDAIGAHCNGLFFDQGSSNLIVKENIVEGVDNDDFRFNRAKEASINLKGNFFEKDKGKSDARLKGGVLQRFKKQ